jgi:hypothetical protein
MQETRNLSELAREKVIKTLINAIMKFMDKQEDEWKRISADHTLDSRNPIPAQKAMDWEEEEKQNLDLLIKSMEIFFNHFGEEETKQFYKLKEDLFENKESILCPKELDITAQKFREYLENLKEVFEWQEFQLRRLAQAITFIAMVPWSIEEKQGLELLVRNIEVFFNDFGEEERKQLYKLKGDLLANKRASIMAGIEEKFLLIRDRDFIGEEDLLKIKESVLRLELNTSFKSLERYLKGAKKLFEQRSIHLNSLTEEISEAKKEKNVPASLLAKIWEKRSSVAVADKKVVDDVAAISVSSDKQVLEPVNQLRY